MTNQTMISGAQTGQIDNHQQSNFGKLDHTFSTPSDLPKVSADRLNQALCSAELDEIRAHHLALAMAVIELAHESGSPFPWTHDDPTIALLRAAAKLSFSHPDAASSAAADLVERLSATTPRTA